MGKFKAFFGLKLSFSATEQLSHTLQGKDTSLQQAVAAFQLAVSFLERQRTEEAFSSFYKSVLFESHNLTEKPVLPHQRESTMLQLPHSFSNPESLYRQYYFEALDAVIQELKSRFDQPRGMYLGGYFRAFVLICSKWLL